MFNGLIFLVFLGFWFWFEVAMSHCRALPFAVKVCIRAGPISFSPFAVKVCIRLVLKMTPPALVCRFWLLGDPKWSIGYVVLLVVRVFKWRKILGFRPVARDFKQPPFQACIPADFHTYDVIHNNKQQRTTTTQKRQNKSD